MSLKVIKKKILSFFNDIKIKRQSKKDIKEAVKILKHNPEPIENGYIYVGHIDMNKLNLTDFAKFNKLYNEK